MEQPAALAERIRTLKSVASSMREGSAHTHLLPEVDKVLALPDEVPAGSVGEREAIARQVREYEQTFDRLGYTLLEQIMPATRVSPIFQVVQAADEFKARLRGALGRTVRVGDRNLTLDRRHLEALTRYSLSIGTPPVTRDMAGLVGRILFGREVPDLMGFVETLPCDPVPLRGFLELLGSLAESSLHYCTAAEEATFLRESVDFVNFEGATLFNRVVVTEHPDRVVDLLGEHVFDKFGSRDLTAVRRVPGVDAVGDALIEQMRASPNQVFVARVTRIPHRLFAGDREREQAWRSVIGRLVLVDDSPRARMSNATLVFSLFPHVARTLSNLQTGYAGRPANTQLVLRCLLERFPPGTLARFRAAIDESLARLEEEGIPAPGAAFDRRPADGAGNAARALARVEPAAEPVEESPRGLVDEIRSKEWRRDALGDWLSLTRLRRVVGFLEDLSRADEDGRRAAGKAQAAAAAADWMRYFYKGLPAEKYRATVLPGGGRGALFRVGEWQRESFRAAVERFRSRDLPGARTRLEVLKAGQRIPRTSSDEVVAAMRQSRLQALSPTQWNPEVHGGRGAWLARTLLYRAADAAGRLTRKTGQNLEKAAFANVTGGAAALLKGALGRAGLGALHGHLEDRFGRQLDRADQGVRRLLTPFQEMIRTVQRAMDDLKGGMDPVALGEVETLLQAIERGTLSPGLILPEMSWTYEDVFPDKDFPAAGNLRVPLNDRFEMDPLALLERLLEKRYLLRDFPEVFDLWCRGQLLLLNTPHNPTGVAWRRETVLKLLQIASEFGITVLDDNAYHRLVTRARKNREGDACVAQLYERHRAQFPRPVRIVTAGATTKGLQGSGDRTGLVHANDPDVVRFVEARAPEPHRMSLYVTRLKLENGLAVKRYTRDLERLAGRLLRPGAPARASDEMRAIVEEAYTHVREESFPAVAFLVLLEGWEEMLRLEGRGATVAHLSDHLSRTVGRLKALRLEVRLRSDVEERLARLDAARERALPGREHIPAAGAFYACIRLCDPGDDRGVQEFLRALSRHRKVDVTWAGQGFVRVSLGGTLPGDEKGYERYGQALELYLGLLGRYWAEFDRRRRDPACLPALFCAPGQDPLEAALADLAPLLEGLGKRPAAGAPLEASDRGVIYAIEEGRSPADKVFVPWQACATVEEMLHSRTFRVVYRRLLKRVWRDHPDLQDLAFAEVDNQYGPLACLKAYRDRSLIDPVFRDLMGRIYRAWNGPGVVRVLSARLDAACHDEKLSTLQGIHRQVADLVNELMHAFEVPESEVTAHTAFEVGFEVLESVKAAPGLPDWLRRGIEDTVFAGVVGGLNPSPAAITGATKRVSDYRYGFTRRDGEGGDGRPGLDFFRRRLEAFARSAELRHYVNLPVQVGPFRMLVVIHRSCFHLVSDALRLFPQIEDLQRRERLDGVDWDGVLLYGIPARVLGDSYRSGYILDRRSGGPGEQAQGQGQDQGQGQGQVQGQAHGQLSTVNCRLLPVAWVAREDATDYVGFFKKSLLTLHNERVKAMGGMPVHGSMFTITFRNGLRKTLVFSADSGAGKSETLTAMMDQLVSGEGPAAEVRRIDILAGDMLSLWRGEDRQVYAFGTEQGDFLRMNDITESWKARFGDLLKRGSYTNPDHPTNPRVTIPGLCDARKLLAPTRVNGFFYINNYEAPRGGAVELSDDPHAVLKNVLVRGLRKNKGTSGDQPSLRAGLEAAGATALVTRFRHAIDTVLDWQEREVDGKRRTCLAYRDGAGDVFTARELVQDAFQGQAIPGEGGPRVVRDVEYDVIHNLFRVVAGGERVVLSRELYDAVYEPLVSTFCGNPFVDPEGMDRTLDVFAETMREARVHTGVVRTQLARPGYEFEGPAQAARDVITFLLQDEEVNARFQRNKEKVHRAVQRTYGGILEPGWNLPVELEGYNLLLLEAHESTHVAFLAGDRTPFTLSTPFYRYEPPADRQERAFAPAIALPETIATIADILSSPDDGPDLSGLQVDPSGYRGIRHWNNHEELVYQVLLVDGVVDIGSSETDLARFPAEVRKADRVARALATSSSSS